MPDGRRARKVDDPALHRAVLRARRAGQTIDREALAAEHKCSVGTVQAVRHLVDAKLAAEAGKTVEEFTGGRLVRDFNGRKLYYLRRYQRFYMQELLADKAGVSRGEVGHLERLLRKPTLRTLVALAEALKLKDADGETDPSPLCGMFAEQPRELIAEGETIIYDPLHPVPLAELYEPLDDGSGEGAPDERRQTA